MNSNNPITQHQNIPSSSTSTTTTTTTPMSPSCKAPSSLPSISTLDLPSLSITSPLTPTPSSTTTTDPMDQLIPNFSKLPISPAQSISNSNTSPSTTTRTTTTAGFLGSSTSVPTRSPSISRSVNGNLTGVKVPPGLAAKMAAMAKRHDQSPSMRPDQRLDPTAFMGPKAQLPKLLTHSSTNSSTSSNLSSPSPTTSSPNTILKSKPPLLQPSMSQRRQKPMMRLGDINQSSSSSSSSSSPSVNFAERPKFLGVGGPTPFSNFSKIVDPNGSLNFGGKAVLHAKGVDFTNGSSFKINMEEIDLLEELGKGNYGTVQKVFHKPTRVVMAMKEIRLELDHSKLKAILTELDILHRATSETIVEFYGAFFIESCVYYCMEYMDGGSLDKLAGADVPEEVLAIVTGQVVEGLRFLKDELQTMHRDVKPTNVLINRRGQTKLCDFGVSGQLERSLAKTNIGCQSYMAPERIQGEQAGSVSAYTVASDVWSLGLSIIEFAIGHYPYPPETYSNIFAQLNAIVHGEPPNLPDRYSSNAKKFVKDCLKKNPDERPSYKDLLNHSFLLQNSENHVDMVTWVEKALEEVKFKNSNKVVNG